MMRKSLTLLFVFGQMFCFSQTPSETEEDYEQYGEVEYVGTESKTFANAKINGLAPQRFASIAWDAQLPYDLSFVPEASTLNYLENAKVNYAGGIRLYANIPIISKNSFLWQLGLNYLETRFDVANSSLTTANPNSILQQLDDKGLKSGGLFTTIYKPLNKTHFILFQGQSDLSGDYNFANLQSLKYLRYSLVALWGKRPNDRLQWGLGISQTYRAGSLNYFPVIMYNKTSMSGKWGAEILFPAKAHARYKINGKSLLLMGYELEGNSYRLNDLSTSPNSLEIRRSELRPRIEYQKQLIGFFWMSAQIGMRLNYSFDVDDLPNGNDFYRGFFGTQSFAALGSASPTPYFNLGIHFVSP